MKQAKDLTGERFGRLVVLSRSNKKGPSFVYWNCRCDCGKTKVIGGSSLKSGRTQSCGCAKGTHKMARHELYDVWCSMVQRCHNPECEAFPGYGGRGITVCLEWRLSVAKFIEDMGPRPKGTEIERIDNNKGYYPGNCRWATRIEQCNNKRNNRVITWKGKTQSASQWAKELGIGVWTSIS